MSQPKPWSSITIVLLICAVCLAAGLSWLLLPRPPALTDPRARSINFANFLRIEQGMPEREVDDLLGVPPGDYRAEPGFYLVGPGHIRVPPGADVEGGKLEVWYVPRFHVEVFYDQEGRVLSKYWHDAEANQ